MAEEYEQRILNVVEELKSLLTSLDGEGQVYFPYGKDWTLLFAIGDRAVQIRENAAQFLGVEAEL